MLKMIRIDDVDPTAIVADAANSHLSLGGMATLGGSLAERSLSGWHRSLRFITPLYLQ